MNEKPEDFAPPLDEVADLFFKEDDSTDVDLSKGRPKKEVTESNNEPKPKPKAKPKTKAQKVKDSLIKEANFLKKFEEKLFKRQKAEAEQKLERQNRKDNKQKIKEKKARKELKPYLGKNRYASIGANYCEHEYKVRHMNGGRITTCCQKCSVEREWTMAEWSRFTTRKQDPNQILNISNPDQRVFPM